MPCRFVYVCVRVCLSCICIVTFYLIHFWENNFNILHNTIKMCDKPTSGHSWSYKQRNNLHRLVTYFQLQTYFYIIIQDTLLFHLGVGLHEDQRWPLRVYPRTLSVLAEVLLLRQQREREGSSSCVRGQTDAAIIQIWTRFIDTLTSTIIDFDNNTKDFEGRHMLVGRFALSVSATDMGSVLFCEFQFHLNLFGQFQFRSIPFGQFQFHNKFMNSN